MSKTADVKQLRSFGLLVGAIFLLLGVWPRMVHGIELRWWAIIVSVLLIFPALLFPKSLALPHKGWMALAEALGWVNTRVILGVIFYLLLTPIGVVRRMLGNDPMGRHFRPDLDSYRIPRQPRPGTHMNRQY
jgi:hypothetical protein